MPLRLRGACKKQCADVILLRPPARPPPPFPLHPARRVSCVSGWVGSPEGVRDVGLRGASQRDRGLALLSRGEISVVVRQAPTKYQASLRQSRYEPCRVRCVCGGVRARGVMARSKIAPL